MGNALQLLGIAVLAVTSAIAFTLHPREKEHLPVDETGPLPRPEAAKVRHAVDTGQAVDDPRLAEPAAAHAAFRIRWLEHDRNTTSARMQRYGAAAALALLAAGNALTLERHASRFYLALLVVEVAALVALLPVGSVLHRRRVALAAAARAANGSVRARRGRVGSRRVDVRSR